MGSLSDYAEDTFLDHLLNVSGGWTTPANVYLALFVGDPTDTGSGGTEVSGNGYTRKAISFGAAVAATRSITQDAIVQFDEATGSWGPVDYYGIFDAAGNGNFLAYGALSSAKTIVSGNTPSVASGQVVITVSAGGCSNYLAKAMLDHIFNATGFTQPSVYVALCDTAIADTDDGTTISEIGMTGYARESKAAGATDWSSVAGAASNITLIDFGALTGTTETVEAICLTDNTTTGAGNVLVYDNTPSQAIGDGDTVQIPIGDFDISLT